MRLFGMIKTLNIRTYIEANILWESTLELMEDECRNILSQGWLMRKMNYTRDQAVINTMISNMIDVKENMNVSTQNLSKSVEALNILVPPPDKGHSAYSC